MSVDVDSDEKINRGRGADCSNGAHMTVNRRMIGLTDSSGLEIAEVASLSFPCSAIRACF